MKLERGPLTGHLERVHVAGALQEVVLDPGLACAAMTPDLSLLVLAPEYDGANGLLPEAVGIIDLPVLIQSIKALDTDGTVEVQWDDDEKRLVLQEEAGERLRLMTGAPDRISTRFKAADRAAVQQEVDGAEGVALPVRLQGAVRKTQELFSALEIRLQATPSGTTFVVGPSTGHFAEVPLPELQAEEEYDLILQGNTLAKVLGLIEDGDEATIALTGPDSVVVVQVGAFTYVLSPMTEAP